jgi:hypothetical protein
MRTEDEEDRADPVEDVFVADHDAGSVGYVAARVAEHRTAPHRTAPHRTAPHRTAEEAIFAGAGPVTGEVRS